MAVRQTFGWRRVRVGALILVGVLLLAYGVFRVGEIFDVFAARYSLVTAVPSVVGLRKGSPVTLAGQRVGQVKRIEFIPIERRSGTDNLTVELRIARQVQDHIREDSRAFLRSQGLLGDKYVDISVGTGHTAVLQELDTIRAESTMDMDQFMARGGALLDSAQYAVADLRSITLGLISGQGTMGQLLTNQQLYDRMVLTTTQLQQTLQQFGQPNGTFGMLLRDPALYNRLMSVVMRVDSLGSAIMSGQGTLGRLVRSEDLYRSLFSGVSRADTAMGNFSGALSRMTNGSGTLQKLTSDPQLYDALLKAIVDLQTLIADLRANPKKFVPGVNVRVF